MATGNPRVKFFVHFLLIPIQECGVNSCECQIGYYLAEDGTDCIAESQILEKVKMFKTYRFEELWSNEGDSSGKKLTIIRGNTTIEKVGEDDAAAAIDPLYNLGDRLIIGEVVKADPDSSSEIDKDTLTYAFVYRRHSSSTISPFKLPYSYNLIWDSSGTRNSNQKAGSKNIYFS